MDVHQRVVRNYKRSKSAVGEFLETRFRPLFRQVENEVGTWSMWYDVPLQKRIWLLKNGFLSYAWELYDFRTYNESEYLPYRNRRKTGDLNSPWAAVLNNKYIFHRELEDYHALVPNLYAVLHADRLTSVDADVDRGTDPGEWVTDVLREKGRLVLKPVEGSTGTGIHFVEATDRGDEIRLNGDTVATADVQTFVRSLDEYIVTDHLDQSDWLDEIYPHSLNTMRILTMWDDDANETFIASAILRIGTERSRPVDNFSKGGLSAGIDVETGELGAAATLESGELTHYEAHPETGAKIAGRTISKWDTVRETILEVAESISLPKYVGWDVSLSPTGSVQIIEGNNSSDVDLLQVHEPLLTDDRVRRFYERHDVI